MDIPISTLLRRILAFSAVAALLLASVGTAAAAAPSNDNISSATVIATLPFNDNINTRDATADSNDGGCGGSSDLATVWYTFTPVTTAVVTVDTSGSSYSTGVNVFSGPPGSPLSCSFTSVTFTAAAGTQYFFMIAACCDGVNGGDLVLTVTAVPPPPPPPNDDIANATAVTAIPFTDLVDTRGATTDSDPADPDCVGNGPTVWYSFRPSSNMRVEANTFGSNYDTTLSVYTGSPGNLTQIDCNDDAGTGVQSRVSFDATAGQTYYFMVGSYSSGPGGALVFTVRLPFTIDVSINPTGSVAPKTGLVKIQGTITCSQPAFVEVSINLQQRAGRLIIHSSAFTSIECNGATPWSITTNGENGRFAAGNINVAATAVTFDPDTGEFVEDTAARTVQLKGSSAGPGKGKSYGR